MIDKLKTLRILGKEFAIERVAHNVFSGDTLGRCNCTKQTILLRSDLGRDQMADTLLHECLHALDYTMFLDLEERQVHALAGGLYALLRDNPALLLSLMHVGDHTSEGE